MAREVDDIVLSSTLWSELRSHLLSTNDKPGHRGGNEQMAFILAAPNVSASRIRLVGHELLRAHPPDLDHQSPSAISPNGQFVATALTRVSTEKAGVSSRSTHTPSTRLLIQRLAALTGPTTE